MATDVTCPAVTAFGIHLYAVVWYRRWLRRRYKIVCWHCDLEIREP